MKIPASVLKNLTFGPLDNPYIHGAEDMYERLCDIRDEKVKYHYFDMSTLSNCMELYYKGLLDKKCDTVDKEFFEKTHYLPALVRDVENRVQPILGNISKQDRRDVMNIFRDLSDYYISARYNHNPIPFETFKEAMKLLDSQRYAVLSILDPEKSWDKKKETSEEKEEQKEEKE